MHTRSYADIFNLLKISLIIRGANFQNRYTIRMKKSHNIFKNKERVNKDFDLDIDKILTDHNLNYSDIDFENKDSDVLKSYSNLNSQINKNSNYFKNLRSFIPFFNYKAILKPAYTIVLTTIIIFAVIEFKKINKDVEYAEITINKGEKITLHLNDNFTIWLNSETTIKIPMELKRNAKIFLDGEAYFEVNQNKKVTIISGGITFETKDCDFYINSKFNNELVAHVKEGNLDFYNPDLPKSTKLSLSNNDKAIYNPEANFIAVEKEHSTNYLAWHTGILVFRNEPLHKVINTISEVYQIPIIITNSELNRSHFSAHFDKLEIDEILDIIQSKFNCEISGDGSKIIIN